MKKMQAYIGISAPTSDKSLNGVSQEKLELFVNERIAKIDAFTSLIDKSKQIKLDIQNNCIPTLNKHASKIVNKMTGGEHFSLTLSDTFELLLDGKIISSYSNLFAFFRSKRKFIIG